MRIGAVEKFFHRNWNRLAIGVLLMMGLAVLFLG